MKKIVDMDSLNLPTKCPASEEWDLMDSYCIGYNDAVDDFMKFLNAAPDYPSENKSTMDIQKLYEDFCIYVNNLSKEELQKHVEEARRMTAGFNE